MTGEEGERRCLPDKETATAPVCTWGTELSTRSTMLTAGTVAVAIAGSRRCGVGQDGLASPRVGAAGRSQLTRLQIQRRETQKRTTSLMQTLGAPQMLRVFRP